MPDITIAGATYSDVPSILVPMVGGGNAAFLDTSGATAGSGQILSGYSAYANGAKLNGDLVIQHYYTGSSAPDASLGVDGDIYLETGGG